MMTRLLVLVFVLLQLPVCLAADETTYSIAQEPTNLLDLRDQKIIAGTEEEISRLYVERVKNRTDGQIILKKAPFPKYPRDALDAGIEDFVVLEFIVNKKGKVTEPVVIQAYDESLKKASLACIKQWRFEPIMKDGKPVNTRMRHAFQFKIANL